MNTLERVKLLRDQANKFDQLSRQLHATADQLEESYAANIVRDMRPCSHGNAQAELSTMDVRQVSAP